MKNSIICILLIVTILLIFLGINIVINHDDFSKNTKEERIITMKIEIDNQEYDIELISSDTLIAILDLCPLDLELTKYAGHEYYADLSSSIKTSENTTSNLLAGHIYYWDGGNSFVINYENYDISPYKSVHLGEIKDKMIIEYLKNASNKINIRLEGK